MINSPFLTLPLFVGVLIFIFVFFKYPRWAIAGLIIAKPIIDTTSSYYLYLNVNFLKLYGFLFAVLGVIYIIKNRFKIWDCKVGRLWLIFLGLNLVSIFFLSDKTLLDEAEYFVRILVGFSSLILFFNLFDFEKDKKLVFSIFVISSAICILIWLIEVLFLIPRTSVAGVSDELTRIKGPYHHFFNFPFYGLQLIICALPLLFIINDGELKTNLENGKNETNNRFDTKLVGVVFKSKSINIFRILLYVLMIIAAVIVYKSYTKSGWIALPLILFLWFILRKKYLPALLVVAGVVFFVSVNPFKSEAGSLFRKEIDIMVLDNQKWEPDTLFMGRYRRWKGGMQEFRGVPIVNKLFGFPDIKSGPENDYLRILWHNGIIGLIVFILIVAQSIFLVFKGYIRNKDPVFLVGLLVIVFYLCYAIGSYPLLYPAFNWLVWGTIGFLLRYQMTV